MKQNKVIGNSKCRTLLGVLIIALAVCLSSNAAEEHGKTPSPEEIAKGAAETYESFITAGSAKGPPQPLEISKEVIAVPTEVLDRILHHVNTHTNSFTSAIWYCESHFPKSTNSLQQIVGVRISPESFWLAKQDVDHQPESRNGEPPTLSLDEPSFVLGILRTNESSVVWQMANGNIISHTTTNDLPKLLFSGEGLGPSAHGALKEVARVIGLGVPWQCGASVTSSNNFLVGTPYSTDLYGNQFFAECLMTPTNGVVLRYSDPLFGLSWDSILHSPARERAAEYDGFDLYFKKSNSLNPPFLSMKVRCLQYGPFLTHSNFLSIESVKQIPQTLDVEFQAGSLYQRKGTNLVLLRSYSR